MNDELEVLKGDKKLPLSVIIKRTLKYIFTIVKEFEKEYVALKKNHSLLDFNDIERLAKNILENDQIKIGGREKWLEVLGAGMLHPNVLKNLNIDSKKYTAIAFGCGVERFAMLKYGANDIRQFTASKLEWLKHYSFAELDC